MTQQTSTLSSENFRQLIENNADGILVIGPHGRIRYANDAACQLLNSSMEKLIGQELGVPVNPGKTTEIDLLFNGEVGTAEMRVVETEWDGEAAYLASLRDITERKQTQSTFQFLSEASRRLAALALDPEDTVWTVGSLAVQHLADWCLIDLYETEDFVSRIAVEAGATRENHRIRDLDGCFLKDRERPHGPMKVMRTGKTEIYHEVTPEVLDCLAMEESQRQIFLEKKCRSVMIVPILCSGRDLQKHMEHSPMPCDGAKECKEPLGAITLVFSTTGRRHGPQEQTLAEDLATRAAMALENARLYEGCREGIHRRDQFLAMLGHELRNPLAPILTAAQTLRLRKGTVAEHGQKAVTIIERQARHLIRLVDDLLDLSRVSRGRIQLRRKDLNIHPIIDDAVQASRTWIESRKQKLYIHRDSTSLMVKADPTRLAQVIVNLLNNASRYTPEGGRIDLTVEAEENEVVVRVKDSGVGIPPEQLRTIFDPFVQLETKLDRAEGGMGIGLALVHRLVQLHGGQVQATSFGQDGGSEFILRFPSVQLQSRPARAQRLPRKESEPPSQLHIVLVEDKDDAREMLGDLLRLWGHTVHEARDGREGLQQICDWEPDVALVDIGLPEMTGYEVAESVRNHTPRLMTQMVALTGYGQDSDRQQALDSGFDEHLVKPVDIEKLSQLLANFQKNRQLT